MRYLKIKNYDPANGPGIRCSIWVSGCPHHCKGCFNPESWDFEAGSLFTNDTIRYILKGACNSSGLTILGGEPLHPANVDDVTKLCKAWKDKYPELSIWVYTGYHYPEVSSLEVMNYIDVLVDGPFVEELKDPRLYFRGSSNQRVIDVKETRKKLEEAQESMVLKVKGR